MVHLVTLTHTLTFFHQKINGDDDPSYRLQMSLEPIFTTRKELVHSLCFFFHKRKASFKPPRQQTALNVMQKKIEEQLKVLQEKRKELEEKENEESLISLELKKIFTKIDNKQRKLKHKQEKLSFLESEIPKIGQKISKIEENEKKKVALKVTSITAKKRKSNPTSAKLNLRAKATRRKEKWSACLAIHGGTEYKKLPAVTGMIDTLNSKVKAKDLANSISLSSTSLSNCLSSIHRKQWQIDYYINLRKANRKKANRKS